MPHPVLLCVSDPRRTRGVSRGSLSTMSLPLWGRAPDQCGGGLVTLFTPTTHSPSATCVSPSVSQSEPRVLVTLSPLTSSRVSSRRSSSPETLGIPRRGVYRFLRGHHFTPVVPLRGGSKGRLVRNGGVDGRRYSLQGRGGRGWVNISAERTV